MEPIEAPSLPDAARANRPWQDWATAAGIFSPVIVIAAIVVASSYYHEYELAWHNGQPQWVARAVPFTVDGLVLAAAVAIVWALIHSVTGFGRLWRPILSLTVGALATLAANLFAALSYGWLRPAVSVWAGVAALLVGDVGMWWVVELRRVRRGDQPSTVPAACSCPPPPAPPISLAEAAPLARAELKARGEEHGEQELADRFGTTRYKVRSALAVTRSPAVAASALPPQEPPRPATAALNGSAGHG